MQLTAALRKRQHFSDAMIDTQAFNLAEYAD